MRPLTIISKRATIDNKQFSNHTTLLSKQGRRDMIIIMSNLYKIKINNFNFFTTTKKSLLKGS